MARLGLRNGVVTGAAHPLDPGAMGGARWRRVQNVVITKPYRFVPPRRGGLWWRLLRPFLRFLKSYVLKSAWRDGREGFLVAAGSAFYVFMRAAFLWEIRRGRENA